MLKLNEFSHNRHHSRVKMLAKYIRRGIFEIKSLVASIYSFMSTGTFIRVFYDDVWGHKYKGVSIFDRHINFSLPFKNISSQTQDDWLFLYKPQKGDTIIDVGAGIGTETYYFSKVIGMTGKVISIEAHPKTYQCLEKLCIYNKLINVIPLNIAIHKNNSKVIINDPQSHISASIINTTSGYEIAGATLDQITYNYGLEEISFIKMNIEGAELQAIEGMDNTIDKVKYICVSCHDFIADRGGDEIMRTKKDVRNFLIEKGFKIIYREKDPRDWISNQLNAYNPRFKSE